MRAAIDGIVLDSSGHPVAGASIQVNIRGGGLATVYVGETGAPTLANPLTSDSGGHITGWLDRGAYMLTVSGGSISTYTVAIEITPASDAAIDASWIADNAVTTNKLAANAVTSVKIAAGAVGTTQLADGGVTTVKLADLSISTAKIIDGAVTSAKIGTDAVGATQIAAGAVGNSELAANAVATANIQDASVTSAKLAGGVSTNVTFQKAGVDVGTRSKQNFIDGYGITVTVADNAGATRVDVTPTVSLSQFNDKLGSDVDITSADTWVDVLTRSLVAGTWLIFGTMLVNDSGNNSNFRGRLSNNTTHYSSGQATLTGSGLPESLALPATVVVLASTTTVRLQVNCSRGQVAQVQVLRQMTAQASGQTATQMVCVRIA